MGAGGAKPLKADLVAEAVVEALSDDAVKGPVEVKEIEEHLCDLHRSLKLTGTP